MIPKKTGVLVCHHCSQPLKHEHIHLTHRLLGHDIDVDLDFCSADCMIEHFWDERIADEINRRVREEHNWLHKQVCPSCRRRIT